MGKDDQPLIQVAIALILFTVISSLFVLQGLFLFGAIETDQDKSTFYYSIGAASALGLIGIGIMDWLVNKGSVPFKKAGWLQLLLHDPDLGILGDTPLRKYLTLPNIIHFSIIFGIIAGIFAVTTNTFFVALPPTEYQVTETGQLILATEPASISETITLAFPISLLAGIAYWFTKRQKFSSTINKILLFLSSFVIMAIWVGIHYARYGASETQIFSVALFGFLGGLLTFLTGTIIIWYVWHFFNNLFLKSAALFSSDTTVAIFAIILTIYILSLAAYYFYKKIIVKK